MHKEQSKRVKAISNKNQAKGGGVRKPKMPTGKGMKRPTKSGAGMTDKGIKAYHAANHGSKLKGAVTGNVKKGSKLHSASKMKLFKKPFRPTVNDLHENGRHFPPNFLHESWMDYLYWDVELEP